MSRPKIALIAALARNRVIGRNNTMPWRLATDLRRFKVLTRRRPLIMGRKTFQSIGKPLPDRKTIVVTRDATFALPADVLRAATLEEALSLATKSAAELGADTIMIGGGGTIYAASLAFADILNLTEVDATPIGDAYFPAFDAASFHVTFREDHAAGPHDDHPFSFVDYRRADGE